MDLDDGIKAATRSLIFIKTIFKFLDSLQILPFVVQFLHTWIMLLMHFSIIMESSLIKIKIQNHLIVAAVKNLCGTHGLGLLLFQLLWTKHCSCAFIFPVCGKNLAIAVKPQLTKV